MSLLPLRSHPPKNGLKSVFLHYYCVVLVSKFTSGASGQAKPLPTKKSAGHFGFSPSQNSGKSQLFIAFRQTVAIAFGLQVFVSQQSPSAHWASGAKRHSDAIQHLFGHSDPPQSHSSPSSTIPFPHLALKPANKYVLKFVL